MCCFPILRWINYLKKFNFYFLNPNHSPYLQIICSVTYIQRIANNALSTIQGTGDIAVNEVARGHAKNFTFFILSEIRRGGGGLDREVTGSIWWTEWKEAKVEACNKYLLKENFKENHSTELTKIP